MKTIVAVSAKGGSGKSTLAIALAVAAIEAGERVFLIDADPQSSVVAWGNRRQFATPDVDRIAPDKVEAAIAGLARVGYTLAVIDTPGIDTVSTAAAMRAADLALIPARPSALDLEAARPTMATLTRLGRPYAFVLNAAPAGRDARIKDAGRALALLGVLAMPAIGQRADHVDAIGLGLGVTEFAPEGKAAEEIRSLWRWIRRRIGMEREAYVEAMAVA
jgi:chromosome partitioning protein